MPANIVVPELGESVVEARVARWLKKEGDRVEAGEPLVELETDKIDLEVGATRPGVLARIASQDGTDVKIGDLLGVIEEAAAPPQSAGAALQAHPGASEPVAPARERAPRPQAASSPPATAEPQPRSRATPAARRIAREHKVDLAAVHGTGDRSRVTRQDVESHLTQQAPRAGGPGGEAPGPREERVRMSKRRLTIARRLVEAQRSAAMLTTFNEVDMSAVMALRARHKEGFKARYGVSLGIVSFFVKASTAALKAFPRLNAEIQGEEMVLKRYYDIGVAVGAAEGLVVPVLRDADEMSFAAIEQAIKAFARKAEERTLTLEDLRGGTFTITNGGVFGSLLSTPILNPPQVGILGLHKIEDRAVPSLGQIAVRPMMYVALSYDHRIVDGLEAVQFLVRIKEIVEDPGSLLLE